MNCDGVGLGKVLAGDRLILGGEASVPLEDE